MKRPPVKPQTRFGPRNEPTAYLTSPLIRELEVGGHKDSQAIDPFLDCQTIASNGRWDDRTQLNLCTPLIAGDEIYLASENTTHTETEVAFGAY